MELQRKKKTKNCPRCKTTTSLKLHLDGSKSCKRCGQRITSDNRILPSADRRKIENKEQEQMFLL